jgi:hypothetical protein
MSNIPIYLAKNILANQSSSSTINDLISKILPDTTDKTGTADTTMSLEQRIQSRIRPDHREGIDVNDENPILISIFNKLTTNIPKKESDDYIFSFPEKIVEETEEKKETEEIIKLFLTNIGVCSGDECKLNKIELLDVNVNIQEAPEELPTEEKLDITVTVEEERIPMVELHPTTEDKIIYGGHTFYDLLDEETTKKLSYLFGNITPDTKLTLQQLQGQKGQKEIIDLRQNLLDISLDDKISLNFEKYTKSNDIPKIKPYFSSFNNNVYATEYTGKTKTLTIRQLQDNTEKIQNVTEFIGYYKNLLSYIEKYTGKTNKNIDDIENDTDKLVAIFKTIINHYLSIPIIRKVSSLTKNEFNNLIPLITKLVTFSSSSSSKAIIKSALFYIIDILFIDITELYTFNAIIGIQDFIPKELDNYDNYRSNLKGYINDDNTHTNYIQNIKLYPVLDLITMYEKMIKSPIIGDNTLKSFRNCILCMLCRSSYYIYVAQHVILGEILNATDGNNIILEDGTYEIQDLTKKDTLMDQVNKHVEEMLSNIVLTYVKLRCDIDKVDNKTYLWNARYKILVNSDKEDDQDRMIIRYSSYPFPFYDSRNTLNPLYYKTMASDYKTNSKVIDVLKSLEPNEKNVENIKKDVINTYINNYIDTATATNITIQNLYTDQYYFGEFSKIFNYKLSNNEIAKNMDAIKNKIIEGKSSLMIGYGASGAGKTTSLIYNNFETTPEKQNGILIHLAKHIIEKAGTGDGKITGVKVNIFEFYTENNFRQDDKEDKVDNTYTRKYSESYGEPTYTYANGELLLSEDTKIVESTHSKRVENLIYDELKSTDKYRLETYGYDIGNSTNMDEVNPLFKKTIKYNSLYNEDIKKIRGGDKDVFTSYNYYINNGVLYRLDKNLPDKLSKGRIQQYGNDEWKPISDDTNIQYTNFFEVNDNTDKYDDFLLELLKTTNIFTKGTPSSSKKTTNGGGGSENSDNDNLKIDTTIDQTSNPVSIVSNVGFNDSKGNKYSKYLKLTRTENGKNRYSFYLVEGDTPEETITFTQFYEGSPIAMYIIHAIDNDRFVKATENNPNSSRSHSLIFLEFVTGDINNVDKTSPYGKLIVGDFAGVENRFDCESDTTKNKLLTVRRDFGDKITPFYKDPALGYLTPGNTNLNECMKVVGINVMRFIPTDINNNPIINDGREPFIPIGDDGIFERNFKDSKKEGPTMNVLEVEQVCKEIFTYSTNKYNTIDTHLSIYSNILNKFYIHLNTVHQVFKISKDNTYTNIINNLKNIKAKYDPKSSKSITFDGIEEITKSKSINYIDLRKIYDNYDGADILSTIVDRNDISTILDTIGSGVNMFAKMVNNQRNTEIDKIITNMCLAIRISNDNTYNTYNDTRGVDDVNNYITDFKGKSINNTINQIIDEIDNTIGIVNYTNNDIFKYISSSIFDNKPIQSRIDYLNSSIVKFINALKILLIVGSEQLSTKMTIIITNKTNRESYNKLFLEYHTKNNVKAKYIFDNKNFITNPPLSQQLGTYNVTVARYVIDNIYNLKSELNKFYIICKSIEDKISKYKYFYIPSDREFYLLCNTNPINYNFYSYKGNTYSGGVTSKGMSPYASIPKKSPSSSSSKEKTADTTPAKPKELTIVFDEMKTAPESFKVVLQAFKYAEENPPLYQKYNLNFKQYIEKSNTDENTDDTLFKLTEQFDNLSKYVIQYNSINHQILNNMFDFSIAKFKQNECKSIYIDGVCNARRTEGYMINTSLSSVRKMFSRLLKERTKTNLLINPPHFEECDDQYINRLGELFKFANDNTSKEDIIGVIFKTIKDELNGNKEGEDHNSTMNQLIISVFCVLNVSRNANNPPPVPYINLNELRQNYKDAYRLYALGVGNNENFQYTPTTTPETLNDKCNTLLINAYKMCYFYKLFNSNEYISYYYGENKEITTVLEDILKPTTQTAYNIFFDIIEGFITFIDNNNQVSAIGTLEFVDRLSKLNTVDTLCRFEPSQPHALNFQYVLEPTKTSNIIERVVKLPQTLPGPPGFSRRVSALPPSTGPTKGGGEIGHKTSRFRTSFRRRSERNKR